MERPGRLPPLITPPPLPPRGNRKALMLLVGGVVLLLFVGLLWKSSGRKTIVRKELVDRPVAERELLSRQSPPREDLRYPQGYSGVPLVKAEAAVPLPTVTSLPLGEVEPAGLRQETREDRRIPAPPDPPDALPPPPPQDKPGDRGEQRPRVPRPARGARQPGENPPVKTWLFAKVEQGGVQQSPFGDKDEEAEMQQKAGSLIPPAHWEEPDNPDRVLYPSQIMQAQLLHDVNSDIPGEVRLLIVQNVEDKFGHGVTLIPQYSQVIAQTEGTPKFGQKRLDVKIRAIETRQGQMIGIDGASVGDGTGAAGVPGKVDNHYPELAIGAILTIGLSAGSRVAVGNQGTFRPTVQEELVEDVSREINRTGNKLIEQRFNRPPTIYATKDTPLTIQLKQPLSFQTKPRKVSK